MIQARAEFPEEIILIIDKAARREKLAPEEVGALDSFSYQWFRQIFGIAKKKQTTQEIVKKIQKIQTKPEQIKNQKLTKKLKKKQKQKLIELGTKKKDRMKQLHQALRNLDAEESVNEFIDEIRRVVYFNEERQQYFVEENGTRKYVSVGDITSDYAWGVTYFPDSRIIDPIAYRTLAKIILTNEARRNLEQIHNTELKVENPSLYSIESQTNAVLKDPTLGPNRLRERELNALVGGLAEIEVRKWLNRISSSYNLDFIVMRANVQEDSEYKYDFKIRIKQRNRGIKLDGSDPKPATKIGFQLKTRSKPVTNVKSGKYTKGQTIEVDEVVQISIISTEFMDAFKKWLEQNKPSGGPEQFLSPELKRAILKAVTEKLVDIPQDVFDKIQ